ncbi:hypothetical protein ACLQ8T_17260 (plasmid) [Glutamicibacter sp. FR1]|uniref:hypothetical protein n=1 Tax=Glutamicibacter sp. FR1 TaxID=3393744 RepID=UPI0039B04577
MAVGSEELGSAADPVVGLTDSEPEGEGVGVSGGLITEAEGTDPSVRPDGSSAEELDGCAETETSGLALDAELGDAVVESSPASETGPVVDVAYAAPES